jgi:hypothetical protein
MYSVCFKKKIREAIPPFDILRFDIRYSAVRCSARPPAAKAAGLIIKKTVPFWRSFIREEIKIYSEPMIRDDKKEKTYVYGRCTT